MEHLWAAITAMIQANREAARLKTAIRKEENAMKSILQREKKCWVTGDRYNLHEHHIFGGARRKLSEKYGLKVYLRGDWHNLAGYGVHFNHDLDMRLKRAGQQAFELDHSREEFIRIFGKSYIDEPKPQNYGEEHFAVTEPEELPYG